MISHYESKNTATRRENKTSHQDEEHIQYYTKTTKLQLYRNMYRNKICIEITYLNKRE